MCHKYRDDLIARPPTHVFARHARDDPLTPPRLNVMSTMKAWTCAGYGADGNPGDAIAKLEMSEVAIPRAWRRPGAGEDLARGRQPYRLEALQRRTSRDLPLHVPLHPRLRRLRHHLRRRRR